MTRSYSPTAGTTRDQVRERIADFDRTRFVLEDELIDRELVAANDSVAIASLACARILLGFLRREVDRNIGDISVQRRASDYAEHVLMLERTSGGLATMTAGGISISASDTINSDTDFRPHTFGVGFMDRDGGETG